MLRWLSLSAVVLGVVSDFSFGKILKTASEMSTHYDFVVVGGGTAGNVIANRLTEDPNIRVLVIEAGGSNEGVQLLEVPFFSQDIYKTKAYFWNYTTTPQVALAGKSFFYARGHVLGGCSSTRWSWDRLQYYIRKHERWSSPTASPMLFDPSAHGFHGMTEVSLSSVPHSIDEIMIKATEGNSEFPFNVDYNSGKPIGFGKGWQQTTITSNGRRDSSATSYLGPKFIQRANLHVLLNHRVLRLLPAGRTAGTGAHFNAVEFAEIVDGLNTPHIEFFISNGAWLYPLPPAGNFFGIATIGLTPMSRNDDLHHLIFR
ncbi:hypothetical protein EYR36_005273 [Pleurotus pulmonarius]|nr:hypothetical protein EYR36_005273 [Pleurotus pulmonarius]